MSANCLSKWAIPSNVPSPVWCKRICRTTGKGFATLIRIEKKRETGRGRDCFHRRGDLPPDADAACHLGAARLPAENSDARRAPFSENIRRGAFGNGRIYLPASPGKLSVGNLPRFPG